MKQILLTLPLFMALSTYGASSIHEFTMNSIDGKVIDRFSPMTSPDSRGVIEAIEKALAR